MPASTLSRMNPVTALRFIRDDVTGDAMVAREKHLQDMDRRDLDMANTQQTMLQSAEKHPYTMRGLEDAENQRQWEMGNRDQDRALAIAKKEDEENQRRWDMANREEDRKRKLAQDDATLEGKRLQNAAHESKITDEYLALLDRGDPQSIEAAKRSASSIGVTLTPEIVQDADFRAGVRAAKAHAEKYYENNPESQALYFKLWMKRAQEHKARGGRFDPASNEDLTMNIEGAPPVSPRVGKWKSMGGEGVVEGGDPNKKVPGTIAFDEMTGESRFNPNYVPAQRGAGGGGASSGGVYEVKRRAYLNVNPGDERGALEYAAGRKVLSDMQVTQMSLAQAQREVSGNQALAYKSPAEKQAVINQRAAEIANILRTGKFPSQPAPAAPPAASPSWWDRITGGGSTAPAAAPPPARPAPAPPVPPANPVTAPPLPGGTSGIVPPGGTVTGVERIDVLPAPRNPADRVVGQAYSTPNGRIVRWTGTGWLPIQ